MDRKKMFKVWQEIKRRCNDTGHPLYEKYGGSGIGYQSSWEDFEGFYTDMKTAYPNSLVLSRLDDTAAYSKGNCYWMDILNPGIDIERYQAQEKPEQEKEGVAKFFAYEGAINDVAGFSKQYNINYRTLHKRLSRGWSIEKALSQPVGETNANRKKNEQ